MPHAILAAVAESHRDTGAVPLAPEHPAYRPNPWNGWLRDPRVQQLLAARFGDEYPWSASALESYSKLPFQFLLQKVLRYEESVEAEEEVTPLIFGAVAHALLERFYRRVKDDLPAELDATAEDAWQAAMREVHDERRASGEWHGSEVLWEEEWKAICQCVYRFVRWELGHLARKGERPSRLEHSFGFGEERTWVEGRDAAGASSRLRLCGRIDRVDAGGQGKRAGYHVLDYKKARTPGANDYGDGTALQAPLYMQVLENEGLPVTSGYFRSLKDVPDKKRRQYGGKVTRGSDDYAAALRFALSIPGRIHAGLFEPVQSLKTGRDWLPYAAARDIARSEAILPEGNRYEHVEPLSPDPAPDPDSPDNLDLAGWLPASAGSPAPPVAPPANPPRLPFDDGDADA